MTRGRVYFKSVAVGALNFILILGVLGCAATATKNELSPAGKLPVIENKKSITFRYYFKTKLMGDGGVRIYWDESSSKRISDFLVQSGQFNEVIEYQQSSIDLREPDFAEREKQVTKINFPINTDLFLDIQSEGKDYGPHGYMYWGMVHIISIGLIPLYMNADIKQLLCAVK